MDQREHLYLNSNVYCIRRTLNNLDFLFDHELINNGIYNECSAILQQAMINDDIDGESLIPDIYSGVYKHLSDWISSWGIVDPDFLEEVSLHTLDTYSITLSDSDMEDFDEFIEQDMEDFRIIRPIHWDREQ